VFVPDIIQKKQGNYQNFFIDGCATAEWR